MNGLNPHRRRHRYYTVKRGGGVVPAAYVEHNDEKQDVKSRAHALLQVAAWPHRGVQQARGRERRQAVVQRYRGVDRIGMPSIGQLGPEPLVVGTEA